MEKVVCVLFGGVSFEHEVSLDSAYNVIKGLKKNFSVLPVGITKKGDWFYYFGDIEKIKTGEWEQTDCSKLLFDFGCDGGIFKVEENSLLSKLKIDCIFPVIHGQNGEDGKLQSLLEFLKIPFVGCDFLSSALCMNKVLTRKMLDSFNIPGTKWVSFKRSEIENLDVVAKEIEEKLSFPIFTKPASCGSSVGIKKCKNLDELKNGILFAFQYEDEVICEAFVEGKEIECAVLGGENPKASVVGQIFSFGEFYDYDSKYKEDSKIVIPANIEKSVSKKIREIAVLAFKKMGCYGLSRVDFFVTEKDEIFLNEINTMPGFTDISMFSKLWAKSGIQYEDLLKELVELSFLKMKF